MGPPAPRISAPFAIVTDTVEVAITSTEGGPILAGAIELVSPSNKDRPAHLDAFVSKCATYLRQGVGLVIVDIVTERGGNLHDELLARLLTAGSSPLGADLYTTAYRPVVRHEQPCLDVWQEPLALGGPLPTLPLWMRGSLCMPVELEATYERTCREQRIGIHGA